MKQEEREKYLSQTTRALLDMLRQKQKIRIDDLQKTGQIIAIKELEKQDLIHVHKNETGFIRWITLCQKHL